MGRNDPVCLVETECLTCGEIREWEYWGGQGRQPLSDQQLRGEWWLAGDAQSEAVTVVSERLVFKPRLTPVA